MITPRLRSEKLLLEPLLRPLPTGFETTNPKPEILIAWLKEAAKGGVQAKGMRRLCFEASLMLEKLTTGERNDERRDHDE